MKARLLLVEDDPTDEKLTRRALGRSEIPPHVSVVRDGAEALDYLFARGQFTAREVTDLPSLVLLDLKLPRIGGLEVLKAIREDVRTRWLPVVVMTGSNEEQDLVQSYTLGANAYVRKPVDFSEFARTAASIAFFWCALNQIPRGAGR